MPRCRVYDQGQLRAEGATPDDVSCHLTDSGILWMHLAGSDLEELPSLGQLYGLHELAMEDATSDSPQCTKLDHYENQLFLVCHLVDLDGEELFLNEVAAFISRRTLITVSKDGGLPAEELEERWDRARSHAKNGMCFLLHGLLDLIVDSHLSTARSLEEQIEKLQNDLFEPRSTHVGTELNTFMLRKALIELKHASLPMQAVIEKLHNDDELELLTTSTRPYLRDVLDHVLQTAALLDSLRDVATSILETTLALQNNRLGLITKRVTGYAAMIAVPTAITGFYGQNIPYPGFGTALGFYTSTALLIGLTVLLWVTFKLRDWL